MKELIYAIVFFILFDYFGYNLWGKKYKNQIINPYRITQHIILVILTIYLWNIYYVYGISLLGLWLIGGMDYGYYLIDNILCYFGIGFELGTGWLQVENDKCNWMWFTIIGIILSIKRKTIKEPIKFKYLNWQIAIGIIILVLINLILKNG